MKASVLVILFSLASAAPLHLASVHDCWRKVAAWPKMSPLKRSRAAAFLEQDTPGAGMDPDDIVPFETVTRDGFFEVGCFKDYLYEHADKFGDNKFQYNYGNRGNVSIVHYTDIVPKEDREKMTHGVCFRFCRTVPDMYYFGILNGRDCYCEPFFKRMAGDNSDCDAPCEGDPASLCGARGKSLVFEMHWCADTQSKLLEASDAGLATQRFMLAAAKTMREEVAAKLQNAAVHYQKMFGKVGDSGASSLMQDSKVFAGKLEDFVQDAEELKDALLNAVTKANVLKDKEFTDSDVVTEAEEAMKDLNKKSEKTRDILSEANKLYTLTQRGKEDNDLQAGRQYVSFMGFLDKDHGHDMSTCTGDVAKGPIFETSPDGCAAACDDDRKCVGFSYFEVGDAGSICFLMHKFKTLTHYTKCSKKIGFLEQPHVDVAHARFASRMGYLKAQQGSRSAQRMAVAKVQQLPVAHLLVARTDAERTKGCRCDEELYQGLCYKTCSLLTKGGFTMRSGANACCRNTPCEAAGASATRGFGCGGFGVSGDGECAAVPADARKGSGECNGLPKQKKLPKVKLQDGGKNTGKPTASQMVTELLKQKALYGKIGVGVGASGTISDSGLSLVMCFGKDSEFSGTKPKVEITKAERCFK